MTYKGKWVRRNQPLQSEIADRFTIKLNIDTSALERQLARFSEMVRGESGAITTAFRNMAEHTRRVTAAFSGHSRNSLHYAPVNIADYGAVPTWITEDELRAAYSLPPRTGSPDRMTPYQINPVVQYQMWDEVRFDQPNFRVQFNDPIDLDAWQSYEPEYGMTEAPNEHGPDDDAMRYRLPVTDKCWKKVGTIETCGEEADPRSETGVCTAHYEETRKKYAK